MYRDGWASAMEPALVNAPSRVEHVSKAQKQREADALRSSVEAHIAAGGAYHRLPTTVRRAEAA
ncbi:hypothetical protein [Pseudoxanthomonas winnipegensis]|uniref:Uncharacterized protein n=1 Tax=Pseudoxanthomonas winnipegensis TaxID=2480810 RepID=A0A4Q8LCI5_9GAMM|nr:hypothetical protein [Pseudoxanthomonas winnipegensis]TAA26553.1 hypothetical protein EA660_04790 [Pseudoxanthomonas winnipegensis]